jgi:hypothetical protein
LRPSVCACRSALREAHDATAPTLRGQPRPIGFRGPSHWSRSMSPAQEQKTTIFQYLTLKAPIENIDCAIGHSRFQQKFRRRSERLCFPSRDALRIPMGFGCL